MSDMDTNYQQWHKFVEERDIEHLKGLLHENVEFHSPTIWKPKHGRQVAAYILEMISNMFEDFEYHRQWMSEDSMALEFSAVVDGKSVKGIDLIRWDDEGQIVHFEVMLRPFNTLKLVFEKMSQHMIEAGFGSKQ